jgi:hypothetical protein
VLVKVTSHCQLSQLVPTRYKKPLTKSSLSQTEKLRKFEIDSKQCTAVCNVFLSDCLYIVITIRNLIQNVTLQHLKSD